MGPIELSMLVALIWKLVDFAKNIRGGAVNAWVTELFVWGASILVLWLAASASLTEGLVFAGQPLGGLDVASVVLGGLLLGSVAMAAYDVKKSIDNTQSSATPTLLPPG